KRRISGMALLILALLQRIFLMSSLMLLLVWLIFFMVLIKLLPILGTISGKRSEERRVGKECRSGWWPYRCKSKPRGRLGGAPRGGGRAACRAQKRGGR